MTKLKENNLMQNHEIKNNKSHKKIEEKKRSQPWLTQPIRHSQNDIRIKKN
jgi:hypothetical protein